MESRDSNKQINGSWNLFRHGTFSAPETHCYGPCDCPRYKAGRPYRVPGRKAGMVYVDDDMERAARGD